jgi:hypothetical protein
MFDTTKIRTPTPQTSSPVTSRNTELSWLQILSLVIFHFLSTTVLVFEPHTILWRHASLPQKRSRVVNTFPGTIKVDFTFCIPVSVNTILRSLKKQNNVYLK